MTLPHRHQQTDRHKRQKTPKDVFCCVELPGLERQALLVVIAEAKQQQAEAITPPPLTAAKISTNRLRQQYLYCARLGRS